MNDNFNELKYTVAALCGWLFTLQNINAILQTGILLLSFGSAAIAFYKVLKHKIKNEKTQRPD